MAGVQLLSLRPYLLDTKDSKDSSMLHLAAEHGCVEVMEHILFCKPRLINAEDRDRETALGLACRHMRPEAVACLLACGPAVVVEDMCWSALNHGLDDDRVYAILRLLCTHKPEIVRRCNGFPLLHHVFGFRSERNDNTLFSEELMRTVWQLTPPEVLCAAYSEGTPFEVAIRCNNAFAIELTQGKLSLDEIVKAFDNCDKDPPLPAHRADQ